MADTTYSFPTASESDTGPIAPFTSSMNYTPEKKRAFFELCKKTLQHKEYPKKTIEKQFERPICAVDIETKGLGLDFIVGEAYCEETDDKFIAYSMDEMFEWMIQHPQYLFLSHNGPGYEFCYFYQYLYDYFNTHDDVVIENIAQGNKRIVKFIAKKISTGEILLEWQDTYCLFNAKLEKVAKSYCPDLPKGEPPWNKAHNNFNPEEQVWMDYLHRDCQIVCRAYRVYQHQVYDLFGSPIGVTAGSTAMKAFKHSIEYVTDENGKFVYRDIKRTRTNSKGEKVEYIEHRKVSKMYFRIGHEQEEFARKAYYGAIVNPGHTIGDWGEISSLDVNGAYGYQMLSHKYPVGRGIYTTVYEGDVVVGIYRVRAFVPSSVFNTIGFNPLPERTSTGLVWSCGNFETYVTNAEIAYARKRGCAVEIIEGYIWHRTEAVFQKFIERCQQLELMEEGKYKDTAKYQRNNLYGKFGTKPEHEKLEYLKEDPSPDDEEFWSTHRQLIDDTVSVKVFADAIVPGVFIKEENYDADYMMPHWAAFTTAWQRVYMFEFMEEAYKRGAANVYVDTDSIKSDPKVLQSMIEDGIIKVGVHYGEFKIEEAFERFVVVGPKAFYGRVTGGTAEVSKCKGIPSDLRSEKLYNDAINNRRQQNTFSSTRSLINIIKQYGRTRERLPVGIVRKRTITNLEHSNAWEVVDNKIYPKGYHEAIRTEAANTS